MFMEQIVSYTLSPCPEDAPGPPAGPGVVDAKMAALPAKEAQLTLRNTLSALETVAGLN
jgi:hypothetical protein